MNLHQTLPDTLLQITAASNLQPKVKESLTRLTRPDTVSEHHTIITIDPSWPVRPRELADAYRHARDDGDPDARRFLFALVARCERFEELWILYWRLVAKDNEVALYAVRKFLPQFRPEQIGILGAFWRCYGEDHPQAGDLILQRILELSYRKITNLPV